MPHSKEIMEIDPPKTTISYKNGNIALAAHNYRYYPLGRSTWVPSRSRPLLLPRCLSGLIIFCMIYNNVHFTAAAPTLGHVIIMSVL